MSDQVCSERLSRRIYVNTLCVGVRLSSIVLQYFSHDGYPSLGVYWFNICHCNRDLTDVYCQGFDGHPP